MPLTHTALLCACTALGQDASRSGLDESDIRNWTPNVDAVWGNPEWRRFGDAKIRDDRFMRTDYGPVYSATIRVLDHQDQERVRAHKGLSVRLGGAHDTPEAMLVWDRNLLQCQGGWIGGGLEHSDERFGLMDTPSNAVDPVFWAPQGQAWRRPDVEPARRASWCFPLPEATGRWEGLHLNGDEVVLEYSAFGTRVLEHPSLERIDGHWRLVRHFEVAPDETPLELFVTHTDGPDACGIAGDASIDRDGPWRVITVPASPHTRRFSVTHGTSTPSPAVSPSLVAMLDGDRPLRWPEMLDTTIEEVGTAGPYIHERIVPPFDNPWDSLMFLGGLDVLADGRPIVSTLFGDVWIVSDIDTGTPRWKRFATGLYQPLGIKVVGQDIYVLERGQITQLIDHDADGEADEYRNFNNRWHTPGDAHCYDINLERDPDGHWYLLKNGAWHTPTGGTLLQIDPEGEGDARVWATGFRHCNSMGISPEGQLATGGQQGTWQPATRLDLTQRDGFYGLMDAAHDDEVEVYDLPLVWMPLGCDNSAGDPVWVGDDWGPLSGELLHLSWGQCWILHILQDEVDGQNQGAAVVLPLGRAMAGPARARFSTLDNTLWIAGCMGWQTWGPWDGTLDRIRLTDGDAPLPTPRAIEVVPGGIKVSFPQRLDAQSACDPNNWSITQWNYHWSEGYGSDHWSVRAHETTGEDDVPVTGVTRADDDMAVVLSIPDLRPAMQTRIGWTIASARGDTLEGVVWATTHRLDESRTVDLGAHPETIVANGLVEVHWDGRLMDTEVLVRAVPTVDGVLEGVGIDLDVEDDGPHLLTIEMQDRRLVAHLNGHMVLDHLETDTRVPRAGTIEILGAPRDRFHMTYHQHP